MFEEKDYLMTIIKKFILAIARIKGLKTENKLEESQEVLDETLSEFTGLNKEILEALPYEILIFKVSGSRQINTDRCLMLGELLSQQADIFDRKGQAARARNLYLKDLNILLTVILNEREILEGSRDKVKELLEKLKEIDYPIQTKLLLFQYHEFNNNYGKAEDMLYELIETTDAKADILAKGCAFYERLASLDESELREGNLPLEEVLEGLAKLREYQQAYAGGQ